MAPQRRRSRPRVGGDDVPWGIRPWRDIATVPPLGNSSCYGAGGPRSAACLAFRCRGAESARPTTPLIASACDACSADHRTTGPANGPTSTARGETAMATARPVQSVPPPLVGLDDAFFWDGIAAGVLRLERCARCARIRQPPGPMCPACGALECEVFEPEPRGRVLSWFLPHHPPAPVPEQRIVVLVELDCGARLVLNLRDLEPEDLRLHLPVDVFVDSLEGVALPQARPASREEMQ